MSKVQSIIEEIKGLSLLEASELVKGLEQTFGVSAAAAAVAAAPAAGDGSDTTVPSRRLARRAGSLPRRTRARTRTPT